MNFFCGTWLTGLLTRIFSHEVESGDSILERSSAIQGSPTRSDDSDASSLDSYYSLSSRNHSPIKCMCSPTKCTSNNSSAVFSVVSKTFCTPAFNTHSSGMDGIWDNSRGMASDQVESFVASYLKSSTTPVTNPSASGWNIERSSTTATNSKSSRTISSRPKSSMESDEHLKASTSPKRSSSTDHSLESSNDRDFDTENPWIPVTYSKKSKYRTPKNSIAEASSSKSSCTTVTDSEKSRIKATSPKSCNVMAPSLEISNSIDSVTFALESSNNHTVPDSVIEGSSTTVTIAEDSKLTFISPKSSSVMNTSMEISNKVDSMAFVPVSSNNETIKDDNKKNSANCVKSEISTIIVSSPKSSCTKASSPESFDSIDTNTETFDSVDSNTESPWTTVTYSKKHRTGITDQKNSSVKAQNLISSNTTDSSTKSPSIVSCSKDSKSEVPSSKTSSTTYVNLKRSTNPKKSRDAITNIPRSCGWTQNLDCSRPFLMNASRISTMVQSPSRSKTENLAHSSVEVESLGDSRVPGRNLNSQRSQVDISVPSSGHGKARYSDVVKNSYSNAQSTNRLSDTHGENVTSRSTDTNLITSRITESNEIQPGAGDNLSNPPTIIINPPYYSPLIEFDPLISFTEDSVGSSTTAGKASSSTTSVNTPLCSNSSHTMTFLGTLATSSTDDKDYAISTSSEDKTRKERIYAKNKWDNLHPIPSGMSATDTHTPMSSPSKISISPIGDERKKRSLSRANSHLLPEQPSDQVWGLDPKNENLAFSSRPGFHFDDPSGEKWFINSQNTNSSTVQNTSDSLLGKNSSGVTAVFNSSIANAFLTEIMNESSSLFEHPKEAEIPDNCNERKDCIEILNLSPLTSKTQSSNSTFPCSQLPNKNISESAEGKVTPSQISSEINIYFDSQECSSINSELKNVCNKTSDRTNPNDVHPDPEGQHFTYEDPQGRRSAFDSHSGASKFEDSQGRDCAHIGSQGRDAHTQGPAHVGAHLQDPALGAHDSEREDSLSQTRPVPQGSQTLYPVIQGPIYIKSDSSDPQTVYTNSPWSNYPHSIPPNTNCVVDSSLNHEDAHFPNLNITCEPSVQQTLNDQAVSTQSSFQQSTITNCSFFENQVTTVTQTANTIFNQSLQFIAVNQPLQSLSMARSSSYNNFPVSGHSFQSAVNINETSHNSSGQHIPNPITDVQPPDPNQSSYGQKPHPNQSAYKQRLVRNQLRYGQPSVWNPLPYSRHPEQNQLLRMHVEIRSTYKHSFYSIRAPHGQTPDQNQSRYRQLPNRILSEQSADPIRSLIGQNQQPSRQTPVPVRSPCGQSPDQDQQPSTTSVPIRLPCGQNQLSHGQPPDLTLSPSILTWASGISSRQTSPNSSPSRQPGPRSKPL